MGNKCKYCGQPIVGRSDKQFCDSQCKSAFHNSNPRQSEGFIKNINKILRKNRSILRFASPEGKTTVKRDYLLKLGFNFDYFTNVFVTNQNNTYRYCYEYGYLPVDQQKVLIVKWQPYMERK